MSSTNSSAQFNQNYGGDPSKDQFIYNREGWWPWFSDPPIAGLIITGFFLLWNTIMSITMIKIVFGPLTRGICSVTSCILCIFPHWYVGILIPFFIGGIIPGCMTLFPWFYAICCTLRTDVWGCNPGAQPIKQATGKDLNGA
jgi:hypothetical protein